MSPENVSAVEPQPSGMSELSRLSGVFFEPAKAFEDVAARPSFWVPLILTHRGRGDFLGCCSGSTSVGLEVARQGAQANPDGRSSNSNRYPRKGASRPRPSKPPS